MEVAIFITDKIDFHSKSVTRGKEGHYVMIKGSTDEEDIAIININAFNIEEVNYKSKY